MKRVRVTRSGVRELVVPALACAMAVFGALPGLGSYALLALYAVRGAREAIVALLLSCLLTMSNPELVPAPAGGGLGRYFVIFGAAAAALRARRVVAGLPLVSAVLGLFLLAHSVLLSEMPSISIAKSLAWTVAMVSASHCWSSLSPRDAEALLAKVYTGLTVCMVVSIPFYATGIGFATNSRGFQGVFSHPQAFGAVMGVYVAWSIARALAASEHRSRHLSLAALASVMVVLSQARTGAVAAIAGSAVALCVAAFPSRRRWTSGREPFKWLVPLTGVALVALLRYGSALRAMATSFVDKGSDSEGLISGYTASRGGLIEPMLANISRDPIFGIGLGVPSSLDASNVETIWGFPVGLPVEKGMVAIAVLEELGVFGAALVALWLVTVIYYAVRLRRLETLGVVVAALCLNISEAVLFSPGGMGLFVIVMIGSCAARRPRARRTTRDGPATTAPRRADESRRRVSSPLGT